LLISFKIVDYDKFFKNVSLVDDKKPFWICNFLKNVLCAISDFHFALYRGPFSLVHPQAFLHRSLLGHVNVNECTWTLRLISLEKNSINGKSAVPPLHPSYGTIIAQLITFSTNRPFAEAAGSNSIRILYFRPQQNKASLLFASRGNLLVSFCKKGET
jgi:hypothetical protein